MTERMREMAYKHLVFEESSADIDEAQVWRLAELLEEVQRETLERLRQAAFKIPRPWMDDGITFDDWVKAVDEFRP